MEWADGFVVVYNISDRMSFINAKNILHQIREARMDNCKGSDEERLYTTQRRPCFVCDTEQGPAYV